jgi:hypothetical protein
MQAIYECRFQILVMLFVLQCLYFWPGSMMADSMMQYDQALLGQYSDHHPPLMSFLWRYIDKIYTGHALMFVLQQALVYSAMAVLLKAVDLLPLKNRGISTLFLVLLPNYPQIFIYDVVILKDVQFAFSFLLAASLLTYFTLLKQRPNILVTALILVLMVYGAAVKYQGQFCVLILAIWLGALLVRESKILIKIASGILVYAFVLLAINGINHFLVPQTHKNYSWQLVKLYDIAAISIAIDQDLIPDFNRLPGYSFQEVKDRFAYPAVDPLALTIRSLDRTILLSSPIIASTRSPTEMSTLYRTWLITILKHPLLYLEHRAINMSYILFSRPGYHYTEEEYSNDKNKVKYANVVDSPYRLVNDLPRNTPGYDAIDFIYGSLFYIFMSHLPVVILGAGYFILSLLSWRYSPAAPVLFAFSSIALLMVGILFFMSMAGTPRYTFISIVMIHAMHVFAYVCYKALKRGVVRLG